MVGKLNLQGEIKKTMELYVDYMGVKRKEKKDHLTHLQESSNLLRKYNMKLHPKKVHFWSSVKKVFRLLGHQAQNQS